MADATILDTLIQRYLEHGSIKKITKDAQLWMLSSVSVCDLRIVE